jgi:hypothetical protein
MENDHLPTFRLFVQHGRPLDAREEDELHELFQRHGRVDLFQTRSQWRNSIVTFASTTEATRAKKALHKTDFRGLVLRVQFMKPTRHVLVRGLPDRMSVSVVKRAFKAAVGVERDGKDFVLVFESLSDARDAVADTRPLDGYMMSFAFGNEDRRERKQFSPRRQRSRDCSPPRSKRRSRSPPGSLASAPSPARSIRRKVSPSPAIEQKNVKASVGVEEQPVLTDAHQAVDANTHCRECSRLMAELMHHVTNHHVDANQKAELKAWFDYHE